MTTAQIENMFTYHAPFGNQADRYEVLRAEARNFATLINTCCPESREKSIAITKLQECVQMANAAIAINEQPPANMIERTDGVDATAEKR